MDYKIKFEDLANFDLLEYVDYIERMTFSKDKAVEESDIIISEIMKLSFMPHMYQKIYKNYHSITIKNQRVIYYIDKPQKLVVIYRILWWSQNYETIL